MHHGNTQRSRAPAERRQRVVQIRVGRSGSLKVRFKANRVDDAVGWELCRHGRIARRRGVDADQPAAHLGGIGWLGASVAQLGLPQMVSLGIQKTHRTQHLGFVVMQDLGHRAGHNAMRDAVPSRLLAVGFHGRLPVGCDLEFGPRTFDAKDSLSGFDFPDVR
jgi:hypothetical protein